MPNAKVLNEKKMIVEELTEKLKSQAGVFVNYSGITVNEDTEMRVKLREANVNYTVIKNTLMRLAIKNVGFDALEQILTGTTSLAVSKDDPIAPARVIKEFADKFSDYFEIKGGFMDGRILSVGEVNALATIPPLQVLQAQLLGIMLAPIASLAVVLGAIADKDSKPEDTESVEPVEAAAAEETADTAQPEEPAAEETAEATEAAAPAEAPVQAEAQADEPKEAVAAAPAEEAAAEEAVAEETAESTQSEAPVEEAAAEETEDAAPVEETEAAAPAEEAAAEETGEDAPAEDPE